MPLRTIEKLPYSGGAPAAVWETVTVSALAGVDVSLKAINVAGSCYALSGWDEYQMRLATEPLRMSRVTFAEIQRTPPPPKFAELFAGDVARYTFERLMTPEE